MVILTMLGLVFTEFALFCLVLFVISFQLWRIKMTQDEVLAKVAALKAKVEALIAKPAPAADLQPVGDALDAISAEVDAANPPA